MTKTFHLNQDRSNTRDLRDHLVTLRTDGAFIGVGSEGEIDPNRTKWIYSNQAPKDPKSPKLLTVTGVVLTESVREMNTTNIPMLIVENATVEGYLDRHGRKVHELGAVGLAVPKSMLVGNIDIHARHQDHAA